MNSRLVRLAALALIGVGIVLALADPGPSHATSGDASDDGVVRMRSAHAHADTVARIKADVTAKGIMHFHAVDQSRLAADAGIKLNPSTLLIFGNPGLGSHFITSNPAAGLDWPVRLLVYEDASGVVWVAYTDFHWIGRRHGIANRKAQLDMAAMVIASIASSVAAR